jgi:hypothetical protein
MQDNSIRLYASLANHSRNEWVSSDRSGPVSIGSHDLYLHVSGLDSKSDEPVAIIIQGIATSIEASAAVKRLLAPFIHTYAYERSGYCQSDASATKPTSTTIAAELNLLLKSAKIPLLCILIAHS